MKTRHIHALIAVGAVGGLLGFHHWLTRGAWLVDYAPATGWHIMLEAWPVALWGAIVGVLCGYALSGIVHGARSQAAITEALSREQRRFELEREQLVADRQAAWDEKWRAENAQTRAERRADDLDVALRHAQEALAHAEQRRQNAVAAATRRARKQQRSVDNSPAHTPR
jgi:uncharacterized membrane-anchored protein YhcB (DUF1043 family)